MAQHYTILHYMAQQNTTQHSMAQHYITLHYMLQHYTTQHYMAQHYTTLHYILQHYTTQQQHFTTLYNTTLHVRIHSNPLDYTALHIRPKHWCYAVFNDHYFALRPESSALLQKTWGAFLTWGMAASWLDNLFIWMVMALAIPDTFDSCDWFITWFRNT